MELGAEALGVAYYKALGLKDISKVSQYLHRDIQFTDPQETVVGKEAVLKAAQNFMTIFSQLQVRAQFGSENQAMIVYEVEIPNFSKRLQAASFLHFREGLISKIELFYDASGFARR